MQDPAERRRALEASWRDRAALWIRAVRNGAVESRRLGADAALLDAVCRQRPREGLDLGCEAALSPRTAQPSGGPRSPSHAAMAQSTMACSSAGEAPSRAWIDKPFSTVV